MTVLECANSLLLGVEDSFDESTEIGKFGFGLPNVPINQARKVAVYTKTADDDNIYRCFTS
ncbi:TPA: hypothetical protein EYN98_29020 [Candidatus Poribacteria bacterium]|jgi:hypothetical protein|nr:hypothetical protein [Candidatus Poribacteria bacterium]HIA70013.1 hypothetical protein [Candidatus Poribacteria bacterium]HIB90673.1 hypothetical protein [Candidatus Poribacteria bacterium]HIB99590.1 hypothetical protein [Candidatus Poribacteria bacterium]HIM10408.1 hypothetical protein [Candidatus Poribacteria bacterium]